MTHACPEADTEQVPIVEYLIDGKDWAQTIDGLNNIVRLGRQSRGDLIIGFGQKEVRLTCGATSVSVPALGNAAGSVAFPRGALHPLKVDARSFAKTSIRLWLDGGRLHIGNLAMACTWQPDTAPAPPLALNASLLDVLRLPYGMSQEELAAAGLACLLAQAEERLNALVGNATHDLAPLGIPREEIRQFVVGWIKSSTP